MNKEYFIELIHSEIDGTISHEEKEKLHQYLARDAEINQLYLQLVNSQQIIDRSEQIDPPDEMKDFILNSIDQNKYTVEKKANLFNRINDFIIKTKPTPKYAYSFSIGLVLGAFAILMLLHDFDNLPNIDSKISGAIISETVSGSFEITDNLEIDKPEVTGNIRVSRSSDLVKLELFITSEHNIEIKTEFDSNDIGFISFGQLHDTEEKLNSGVGSLIFDHQGSNNYVLFFSNRSAGQSQIGIKIFSKELIFEEIFILE